MSASHSAVHDTVLLSEGERRALAWRLSLSLAAAGALILSVGLNIIVPAQHDVAELVAGIAALLVGVPALQAAWRSLRYPDLHGITDQLIALAFIAAWASGDLITATLLPLIMMVGHILEERSLLGSQEAIRALSTLTQTTARRIENGEIVEVDGDRLRAGDLVEVRAGDRIPADGVVESGGSSVDTSSITGESVPTEVISGSEVFNGSINLDGLLHIRVSHVGEETTLGRVIALMQEAENIKPAVTRLLERYAGGYLALVLLLTASLWFLTGSTVGMLAVLVASCPCALVLAAPATSIAAIAVASRHGILVKGAAFLEQLASVDAVIFDKTGTLTLGELRLVTVLPEPGTQLDMLVRLAGSLGAVSSHPVSRAVSAQVDESERLPVSDAIETRGLGIVGFVDGDTVALGRPQLFETIGIAVPPAPDHVGPLAGVSRGKSFLGWLLLADELRAEAAEAVDELKELGLSHQMIITGDREAEAQRVARRIHVENVHAEALPDQKMQFVLNETKKGLRPMVVGDGINDALALKVGAVGVAMGARGTDVALASADLVLMTNDLRRLGTCIRLSRRCRRTIFVNVGIGLGWTVAIIGMAAAGVFGASGALIAAVLHNAGTLAVMANAGRLLKFQDINSATSAARGKPNDGTNYAAVR
ncbi:MAG TPA: cation-translocating P-type ATPase [Bradyrhizobium sp.]|nr:cation-translocating P-type ATPase [Bradyrhizobium sp.]